jgi:hypothetical protein
VPSRSWGVIDGVALYATELSGTRIAANYNAGIAMPPVPDYSRFPKPKLRR